MTPDVPEYIEKLIPYQPGKPIEELERELGISDSIKLASNENPVGPSPAVVEAIMQNAGKVSRYPDGGCYYLKSALAGHLGVSPGEIVVGNGSNEVIELAIRAFVRTGDEVLSARGAFLVYDLATRAAGGVSRQVPLRDLTHDLEALAGAVTDRTRIIFVSNPNNPTGTVVTAGEVETFLDSVPPEVLKVFDEAYYEYVDRDDFPDAVSLISGGKHENIVVMRTFSKAYGLAGLRIGYGVADKGIIEVLNKVRQPFNVNFMAQVAAMAALQDQEHLQRVVSLCSRERERLAASLGDMGLKPVPSETNFILVQVDRDGREVYQDLLKRGVIVRAMHAYGFPDHIRVTVGTPEENDRFLQALSAVLDTQKG